jgi:hypothetical protein
MHLLNSQSVDLRAVFFYFDLVELQFHLKIILVKSYRTH